MGYIAATSVNAYEAWAAAWLPSMVFIFLAIWFSSYKYVNIACPGKVAREISGRLYGTFGRT
jgi:hypothetical protein